MTEGAGSGYVWQPAGQTMKRLVRWKQRRCDGNEYFQPECLVLNPMKRLSPKRFRPIWAEARALMAVFMFVA